MEEIKEKKKKSILKKVLIAIVIVISVIAFGIVALVIFLPSDETDSTPSANDYEEKASVYDELIGWEEGEDDYIEDDLSFVDIMLSDSSLKEFEAYLNDYYVDYEWDNVYNIDKALELAETTEINTTKHKYDVRVNGALDANALYKLVKDNNKRYIDENLALFCEEYSDKALKQYCFMMVEMLNHIYEENPSFDFDSVCCYLNDLKILDKVIARDLAGIDLESCVFHINEDKLESWSGVSGNEQLYEETMYHEMMHIYQIACSCNCNNEVRVGINHQYNDLEINPISWYWVVESSAEMNACEILDLDYFTYHYKIGYLQSLNYIASLTTNAEPTNLQDLCFTRDSKIIYDIFDVNSQKDKYEFIKMMYNIEIVQQNPSGFCDWYSDEFGIDLNDADALARLRLDAKYDSLLTMTKLFYRNLARLINTGDACLEDMYYLIRIFECDLQNHLSNNEVGYLVYYNEWYPEYLSIQEEFFNAVSKENDISVSELAEQLDGYSMNIKSQGKKLSSNFRLDFLSDEQKDAVFKYCREIYKKGYPSIRKANDLCLEWLPKAPVEDIVFDD